jgi:hypothetical protein
VEESGAVIAGAAPVPPLAPQPAAPLR